MSGTDRRIDFAVIAVGLFAVDEIVQEMSTNEARRAFKAKLSSLIPTRDDIRRSWAPIVRGTALGAVFGPIPGMGTMISSFKSYTIEKRLSKTPERFGRGAIGGVAGPEAANNACSLTGFIPMLSLGIPNGASMALLLGALMVQVVTPGPRVVVDHPDLFWGLIASMLVGNVMLLALNLPMVGVWARLLNMDYRLLYPAILMFCCIGVYSDAGTPFAVFVTAIFGLMGYIFHKFSCPLAPLLMGFIMGPMLEENFRRSMRISKCDPMIFLSRSIAATCAVLIALVLAAHAFKLFKRTRIRASQVNV